MIAIVVVIVVVIVVIVAKLMYSLRCAVLRNIIVKKYLCRKSKKPVGGLWLNCALRNILVGSSFT